MKRIVAALLIGVALLGEVTGCSTSGAPNAPGPSLGASSDPLPARPRVIRMDGLDPCGLLTQEVLQQTGVKDAHEVAAPLPGVRICSAGRDVLQHPSASVGVYTATNQDVRNVLSVGGSEVTTVAGFGAVEIPDGRFGNQFTCDVRVDVAPNQGLWVSYDNPLGDEPGATHELMCQRAHTAAETIMRDLLARTK